MDHLVYPRERSLGLITLILGSLFWLLLAIGTMGVALLFLGLGFLLYLFAQSALIAYIKGNGVALTATQFPDLHAHFEACCERLQINKRPQAFVLNGGGALNAFATKFLGREYVVILSDVVDAMDTHPDGVRFYLGHELGHLRMKHLSWHFLRWPVLWLPLLGAAYARAREYTCDRHGQACSSSPENAARALLALAVGGKRWADLNLPAYQQQAEGNRGFWTSFHELCSGYPWLSNRALRALDAAASVPRRNPLAYVMAAFVPFAGRLGAGFGLLILVYVVGVLAAVAIPAYQDYSSKAGLTSALQQSQTTRTGLAQYYEKNEQVPDSLAEVGLADQLADGSRLSLNSQNMVLSVQTKHGELKFVPRVSEQNVITWECVGGASVPAKRLPSTCKHTEE
ncbi:MAG: M48 family metalloprotease [Burkholderiaceae bacterium]|nr:M48 family metalloprotease [Burkholderiaceae bacterium]